MRKAGAVAVVFGLVAVAVAVACVGEDPQNTGAGSSGGSCADGQTTCGGRCIDTRVDPAHCGACDHACQPGEFCDDARCSSKCSKSVCGTFCVDTSTDRNNCGGCGNLCASACVGGQCPGGLADGGGGACDASVLVDPNNCGTCGHVCSLPNADAGCMNGQCVVAGCVGTFRDCDDAGANGCETNIAADPNNCTKCGNACGTYYGCNGNCAPPCRNDGVTCGSSCCNPNTEFCCQSTSCKTNGAQCP